MLPHELDEMERLLTGASIDALWTAQPGPQTHARDTEAFETLYGGSAGGGKSDLILGLAATEHRKALILRRVYKDLEGAGGLIERSRELLEGNGSYNGSRHLWRNIPGDRMLEFAGCEEERTKYRFRGRPHDLKAFDEVTEFTESQYLFITGWTRTTIPDQRCRVIATCNPPTSDEGLWVIQRWGAWLDPDHENPAEPGELRWYAMIDGVDIEVANGETFEHNGETIIPRSRTFIPASLEDNQYLRDGDYRATLQGLPEPLRSQLLYGDFNLEFEDDPWQVIPSAWVDQAMERWKYTARPEMPMSGLGVDVARGGKDNTILTPRYGSWFGEQVVVPGKQTKDGPEVAALIMKHRRDEAAVLVDEIGAGYSVVDSLRANEIRCLALNGARKSQATDRTGKLKFKNKRAEWYWRLREALDPDHGIDVCLPPSPTLKADLCAPKWRLTTTGVQIEGKPELIKRLGRSTDFGDSVVYVYAEAGIAGVGKEGFALGEIMVSAEAPWDFEG